MISNELLTRARKNPDILTPSEVQDVIGELQRERYMKAKVTVNLPVAKDQSFYRSLLAVSTGTLATLTGVHDYAALSVIESKLAIFYLFHQDAKYDSWMDVWEAFVASPEGLTA